MAADPVKQVGNYTIYLEQELGRGGFGVVFKARNNEGTTVAAKRINLREHQRAHIPEAISFYNRPPEQVNLIQLFDIKRVKDAVRDDFWVFMQCAEFGDLDNYFTNHFQSLLGTRQKVLLMRQIASGIAYLHSQGIVHRDIKPGNILVTGSHIPEETILKISDMGLAKYLDQNADSSGMSSNVGTKHFKAPEFWAQAEDGSVRYHRSVDTFAAGLTFQAMLLATEGSRLTPTLQNTLDPVTEGDMPIGRVMLSREKNKQTSVKLIADEKEDNSLTRGLKRVISRMVCMVPEHRISMAEVGDTLSSEERVIQQVSSCNDFHFLSLKSHVMRPISHTTCAFSKMVFVEAFISLGKSQFQFYRFFLRAIAFKFVW